MNFARHALRVAVVTLCMSALGACTATTPGTRAGSADRARIADMQTRLRPAVIEPGQAPPRWTIAERMAHYNVPGVSVAILRNGHVAHVIGYGVRETGTHDKVDGDTLFSTGSVSKMITAATTLRLVEQGALALDVDVDTYLRRWRIPDAPAITHGNKPTLRMLMSHTSGLGVHGFKDYAPGAPLPTIVQTLDGVPPAQNDPVRFEYAPGTRSQYSGGGITVEQLVLEDATQRAFPELAQTLVFEPLHMTRSNFENPLAASRGNIAKAYDDDGKAAAAPLGWQSMPELAASGLWASARDLGEFTAALIRSYRGESTFLSRSMAQEMMTEVARSTRGLGPSLEGTGATRVFSHGGANDSYRALIEGNLLSGDGIVVLTNGANGGDLGREIRNAAADAFGWPTSRPIQAAALDLSDPRYREYAGAYRYEPAFMSAQGLAPQAKPKPLVIAMNADATTMQIGDDDPDRLLAVAPNRFVAQDRTWQFEFHRNASGTVYALTLDSGTARVYYVKETPHGEQG